MIPLIPGLSMIQTIIVVMIVTYGSGFASGWYVRGKFEDSAKLRVVQAAVEQTRESAQQARKIDAKVELTEHQIDLRSSNYGKEIRKNVRATQPRQATVRIPEHVNPPTAVPDGFNPPQQAVVDCPPDTLSVGAVRLLNDASAGRQPDPSRYGDAKGQAPSDVGLRELSEHLNTVIAQYLELAARHDALVDWVDRQFLK